MSEISKVVFENDIKELVFEDLQPDLVFANEYKKLVFDIVNPFGVGIGSMIIESTFIIG